MPNRLHYYFDALATVTIEVEEDSDAVSRITGPGGDEWRRDLYPLYTEEDVFTMWIDNALRNGVLDVSRLDGWADLAPGSVTISVGCVRIGS